MFIAHANGHPVIIKTNLGDRFVAFESLVDGQEFLRWKHVLCALSTLDDILRLNPTAFPRQFSVLCLPTRRAIEMFTTNPKDFPTGEYLITLKHDVAPPASHVEQATPARREDGHDEFRF
jgi:hypothetical protein